MFRLIFSSLVNVLPLFSRVLQIKKFKPHILQPSESAVLFELTLKSEAVSSDLKLKSFFVIHTNISSVEVPLLSYNGKLTMVC